MLGHYTSYLRSVVRDIHLIAFSLSLFSFNKRLGHESPNTQIKLRLGQYQQV